MTTTNRADDVYSFDTLLAVLVGVILGATTTGAIWFFWMVFP